MRYLLEAYSRGGVATLAAAAARVGVTPARLSQVINRPGALPRRLALRCRARTRAARGANGKVLRVLTPDEVRAARQRHAAGETLVDIAASLGTSYATTWRAVVRQTYGDIGE